MIRLTLPEILNVTDGRLLHGNLDDTYSGYSTDTRSVNDGDFFIPITGDRFDGNDFVAEALSKGATWSLISDLSKVPSESELEGKGLIYVTDTLLALQNLAGYLLRKRGIPVVAVTGSTGKTSTKEMIASVLGTRFKVLRNEGNLNNHIGLPVTCLQLDESHEVAVLEMGMNHSGEIERLADITRPKWAVITNIGLSHIENLGSRDGIFRAKMEVTRFMGPKGTLILNSDDDYLDMVKEAGGAWVVPVGAGEQCPFRLTDVILRGTEGSDFKMQLGSDATDETEFHLKVPGCHNVQNASLAVTLAHLMGLTNAEIAEGLEKYQSNAMRMDLIETKDGVLVINDAYNASPDSVRAAIQVLHSVRADRRIAVLSDMLELGSEAESAHRYVGEVAAEHQLDRIAVCGESARWIAEGALKAGMESDQVHVFENRDQLTAWLLETLESGDAVLVKGSRGMRMELVVNSLIERYEHV